MFSCPDGHYSADGDLDCHRKKSDVSGFCPDGYFRTIHTSDINDQWIHDQDKRMDCLPINTNPPNTTYVAVDSTKTPD